MTHSRSCRSAAQRSGGDSLSKKHHVLVHGQRRRCRSAAHTHPVSDEVTGELISLIENIRPTVHTARSSVDSHSRILNVWPPCRQSDCTERYCTWKSFLRVQHGTKASFVQHRLFVPDRYYATTDFYIESKGISEVMR